MFTRRAAHKGSWYSSNVGELNEQLSGWLDKASCSHGPARAIITPHAGYFYSGECAAFAYKQINPHAVKRVFILGPSHHFYLKTCALPIANQFETPFYNLNIDEDARKNLLSTGKFMDLSIKCDENEHSIEMQFPFIAKIMEARSNDFTVVPIVVGSLSFAMEESFGEILSPYLADPSNVFVISSDFCHWGRRFSYTYCDPSYGSIWQSIENLDHKGMKLIESLDASGFNKYLVDYGNTICGRHPIGVLLQAVRALEKGDGAKASLKFVQYAQSSKCHDMDDSSVSYASASLVLT